MQRKVGIVVDSTFGLDPNYVKDNQIIVVPLNVLIDNKEYIDGEIHPDVVVDALKNKKTVKTSQPAPELFLKAFEDQLKRYEDVICMTISKSLSGTINSANLAKTLVESEHVYVEDTESNINGAAYLAEKLIEYLDEGHSVQEGLRHLGELKEKGSLVFTVDNLQQLVTNGRLSRVQGFIGNILKIKPILRFSRGVLAVEAKVRSFNNVVLYLLNETKKLMVFGKVVVRIAYVDRSTEAKILEHELFQLGENVTIKITGVISPVVSAHVGLGGLGIYITNE
ncbi:MAG TPA: DegV family protein [Acholeplasmataceae bacterium]|nr:DegV family protein [Acholeplasmataceae bacterium]